MTHHSTATSDRLAKSCGMLAEQFALFIHTYGRSSKCARARVHELIGRVSAT